MGDRVVKVRLLAQVSDYEKGMLAAARATQTVGTEAEKLEQKRQAFDAFGRGLVITGAALTATTALSVKAAMGWESAWAGVTKTVEGTPAELARVEEGLRGLTSVLPASHDEIAAVAEAAGQLGIQTGNVVGFTRTMIDLGETTNLSANDAATALARFMNIMGTSQDQVSNLGSALVGLGNNYATTEAEIMEMSMRLAGAGKQIGLSEGDVLGLATALSSVGIEAEAGGSAMSKVMIDIAASVETGGDKLNKFAAAAGMSAEAFAEQWRTSPSQALASFVKGLSNAESQGKSTLGVLADLGITEVRMRDALLRSSAAADQFAGAMAKGNEEFTANNALTLEAAKRYETAESKVRIAGNAIRDAAIDFGQVFLPAVSSGAEAVKEFAGFIGDLPDPVQGLLGILGSSAGAIALVGGSAMLAVPKIAEFKTALQTLKISASTVGWVAGGAIAGLTALVTVIGLVSAAQAAARERAEAYADTLAESTNLVTAATREMADANLSARGSFMWWEDSSAYEKAEEFGVSLGLVKDAALGSVPALKELQAAQADATAALDRDRNQGGFNAVELSNRKKLIDSVITSVIGEADSIEEAIEIKRRQETADAQAAESSRTAAEAYTEESEAVGDLTSQLTGLIDTINAANGVAQDAITANARYQAALDGLAKQVEQNGASLDQATVAGSANAASLAEVADKAQAAAAAQFEQDKATMSAEDATLNYIGALQRQRDAFVEAAVKAGYNRDEVTKLADSIFRMPSKKEVDVLVETANAQDKLNDFITLNNGKRVKIHVDAVGGQSYNVGGKTVSAQANGGIYHSSGVKAFANSGFEPGIYPYRPGGIHKFAEEHAESYISLDPARRQRSEAVWLKTGHALGMLAAGSPGEASAAVPPVYVQNPFTGEYLLAQVSQVAEQSVNAFGQRMSTGLRSRRRGDA